MHLRPDPQISPDDLARGQRALVFDSAWASLAGSLSSGVVLVAFALSLGAGPIEIGLLAAIPYIAQVAQLPAIVLVERVRRRRAIGVWAVTAARVLILALAIVPFLPASATRLPLLIAAQLLICALGSIGGCAINSWVHQLLPTETLGNFFARQLFGSTTLSALGTLAAGLLVDHSPFANSQQSYGIAFAAAGIAGFISSFYLARVPEPVMHDAGPPASVFSRLRAPLRDRAFRRLLVLIAAWNLASNMAAPFLTVYLIQQMGYGLSTVTRLWVLSQLANVLTIYLWGRLSDRLSNKGVLSVVFPVYFACILSLVFIGGATNSSLQLASLGAMHVAMGAAAGGIGLGMGNLGLKLAPQGQGTPYLAMTGLVTAVAGGVAPLIAGVLAQQLQASELSVLVRWVSPSHHGELAVFDFAHWEFLFALSGVLGLYVLHALSRVDEGKEVSERRVIQEFALEALRTVNHLSSIGGVLGSLFPFQRLAERRKRSRTNPTEG